MNVLDVSPSLTLLPVVHGSAAYAVAVRRFLLEHSFDCLAVPLPSSFRATVLAGIDSLPGISVAVQSPIREHTADTELSDSDNEETARSTYVPIDPCQPVIAGLRFAISERMKILFADDNDCLFSTDDYSVADPYALNQTSIERFCSAVLPSIRRPTNPVRCRRIDAIARRLAGTIDAKDRTIALCDIQDWPWLREAILKANSIKDASAGSKSSSPIDLDHSNVEFDDPELYQVDARTLFFMLGELPFITGLFERARIDLDDDQTLVIDGLKELFVTARSSYKVDLGGKARSITPLMIGQCLKYIRNLTLIDRSLTPSFYTIVKSAQQMMGDQYAIHLVNAAREYPFEAPPHLPTIKMGIEQAEIPIYGMTPMVSRLPGPAIHWQNIELNRPALKIDKNKWQMRWNPYQQCSWPEEDIHIESFRNRVLDRAKGMLGTDLARTEKFTTSMMDGLDLRETLRHWYDGGLYVKVQPPSIGHLDATVMLFEQEADPQEYSWRATWFAEHEEESTLAFFATPFQKELIGPGIAVSTYGGAMFLFPPRPIEDIWDDPQLDFADTMEQRMVAAACYHSQSRHIALLSYSSPGIALKAIAKRYKRKLVHVPLGHFADSVVKQLRMFHVLNGKTVRSYASHFIRKA